MQGSSSATECCLPTTCCQYCLSRHHDYKSIVRQVHQQVDHWWLCVCDQCGWWWVLKARWNPRLLHQIYAREKAECTDQYAYDMISNCLLCYLLSIFSTLLNAQSNGCQKARQPINGEACKLINSLPFDCWSCIAIIICLFCQRSSNRRVYHIGQLNYNKKSIMCALLHSSSPIVTQMTSTCKRNQTETGKESPTCHSHAPSVLSLCSVLLVLSFGCTQSPRLAGGLTAGCICNLRMCR